MSHPFSLTLLSRTWKSIALITTPQTLTHMHICQTTNILKGKDNSRMQNRESKSK